MSNTIPIKVISRPNGTLFIDTIDAGEKCIGIVDDALQLMGNMIVQSDRDLNVDVGNGSAPDNVFLSQQ